MKSKQGCRKGLQRQTSWKVRIRVLKTLTAYKLDDISEIDQPDIFPYSVTNPISN